MEREPHPPRRGILWYLVWSSYTPQVLMLLLIIIPYSLYSPSLYQGIGVFLISPLVSIEDHVLYSIAFIFLVLLATYFGILVHRRLNFTPQVYEFEFGIASQFVIYAFITLSVISHVYLILTAGAAYVGGGLLDARSHILNGLGIFLRLYMFSLPILFMFSSRKIAWRVAFFIGFLILVRTYVISERVAVLEYLVTMLMVFRLTKLRIRLSWIVAAIAVLYVGFSFMASVRLLQQTSANSGIVERGGARTDTSVIAYYADTTNKAYYAWSRPFIALDANWAAPYRALMGEQVIDPTYYNAVVSSGIGASELNNPGGLAQDIQDFGILGGLIALFFKTFISTFLFERSRVSLIAMGLFPFFYIRVIEYARFEYFSLPFALYVVLIGFLVLKVLPVKIARRKVAAQRRRETSAPTVAPV